MDKKGAIFHSCRRQMPSAPPFATSWLSPALISRAGEAGIKMLAPCEWSEHFYKEWCFSFPVEQEAKFKRDVKKLLSPYQMARHSDNRRPIVSLQGTN